MNGRDSRPVPDPTALTADLVDKAVKGLREILETRMNGVDREIIELQTSVRLRPHEIEVQITHLKDLHDEKFKGIETRISERDDLRKQAATDAKVGIDAALASAEKLVKASNDSFALSVDKSERATNELLKQQAENQKNTSIALDDKIVGLKERLDRIEGAAVGAISAKTDIGAAATGHRGDNTFMLSLFVAGISLAGLVLLLIRDFAK